MAEVKRRRKTAVAGIAPSEPERDILDQYLYEVSTYPLLKGTEEIEVARRIRAGDPDALQELVQRNLRFVISVAKKYQNRGMPLIDLIGEGRLTAVIAFRAIRLRQALFAHVEMNMLTGATKKSPFRRGPFDIIAKYLSEQIKKPPRDARAGCRLRYWWIARSIAAAGYANVTGLDPSPPA